MKFQDIYKFVTRDVWRTTAEELGTGKRFLVGVLKTIILSFRGFNDNDINMRANSLTFSLMFAVVPILALIIAIARGFGMESIIEDFLNNSFLSEYGVVETIMGFVKRYLETAQGGAFIGIGLLILLWAVYSFFRNVESCFNKIWQVEKNRSYFRQFTNYITFLILIPVLIVTTSGLSLWIGSEQFDTRLIDVRPVYEFLLKSAPWFTSWLIFVLIYKMVPNTKVNLKSVIIPGIFTGTFVQLLQTFSVTIIVFLSRTSAVYGAFAAIPLLLTWAQWTCLVMLLGAELSYAIQNKEQFDFLEDSKTMSRRYKDYITLYICYQIIKRFEKGRRPLSAQEIAATNHLPARVVNQLLSRLTAVHILNELTSPNEEEEVRYQPALDINKITVGMVFSSIEAQGSEEFFKNLPEPMIRFWERWVNLKQDSTLQKETLVKDIIDDPEDLSLLDSTIPSSETINEHYQKNK